MFFKMDKQFCISAVKAANRGERNKLTNDSIYKQFSEIMKIRKDDKNGVFTQVYKKEM